MKNICIIVSALILCSGCVSNRDKKISTTNKNSLQDRMVESWYPVLFNKYNQNKIDKIINSIKNGKVKRITISYDNNVILAEQIKKGIQKELNFAILMKYMKTKNAERVKYDHDRVVVTIYR